MCIVSMLAGHDDGECDLRNKWMLSDAKQAQWMREMSVCGKASCQSKSKSREEVIQVLRSRRMSEVSGRSFRQVTEKHWQAESKVVNSVLIFLDVL